MLFVDPVSCAKHLCDQAELTREQRGPVALLARDMQHAYEQELARRALLTDAQRRAEGTDGTDVVRLPLVGRRLRLLFFGGGGCGKIRIINSLAASLLAQSERCCRARSTRSEQQRPATDCCDGGLGWQIRPAERSTHTSTR